MSLKRYRNVEDLEKAARRRLPRGVYEFVARGTEDDIGLRTNTAALERIKLVPRMLVDASGRSQNAEILGQTHTMPVAVAPMGAAGLMSYQGELAAAQAAARVGIPYSLATAAMTPMEDIAEKAGGRLWFQLYVRRDRDLTWQMIERARVAGFEGLIVTIDSPVAPNREFNERNGFGLPYKLTPRSVCDLITKPRWLAGVLGRYVVTQGVPRHENYPQAYRQRITSGAGAARSMRTDSMVWEDLKALRDRWKGSFLVKGILHPDDAEQAVRYGADAVCVSNHGGRNIDAAVAAIEVLSEIVDRVRGRCFVFFDSGIRRGSDIVKALALGADGVMVGRPVLWGTAVGGADGAEHALKLLKRELDLTQALIGRPSVSQIDATVLHPGSLPAAVANIPASGLANQSPLADAMPAQA